MGRQPPPPPSTTTANVRSIKLGSRWEESLLISVVEFFGGRPPLRPRALRPDPKTHRCSRSAAGAPRRHVEDVVEARRGGQREPGRQGLLRWRRHCSAIVFFFSGLRYFFFW